MSRLDRYEQSRCASRAASPTLPRISSMCSHHNPSGRSAVPRDSSQRLSLANILGPQTPLQTDVRRPRERSASTSSHEDALSPRQMGPAEDSRFPRPTLPSLRDSLPQAAATRDNQMTLTLNQTCSRQTSERSNTMTLPPIEQLISGNRSPTDTLQPLAHETSPAVPIFRGGISSSDRPDLDGSPVVADEASKRRRIDSSTDGLGMHGSNYTTDRRPPAPPSHSSFDFRAPARPEYDPRAVSCYEQPRHSSFAMPQPVAHSRLPSMNPLMEAPAGVSPMSSRRASEVPFQHPAESLHAYNAYGPAPGTPYDPYGHRGSYPMDPMHRPGEFLSRRETMQYPPDHLGHPTHYAMRSYSGPTYGVAIGPAMPMPFTYSMQQHEQMYAATRRRRGNLPKEATTMLKQWFEDHKDSPYPTEDEKTALCDRTGLSLNQVSNWFINARRRTPGKEAAREAKEAKDAASRTREKGGPSSRGSGPDDDDSPPAAGASCA